ncbi:MAG TPA: UDP-N-acetylglucosamine--N-acetylmuramyl-(pentapeptide) pyrophosphoryl-undecaprenol N-acetylglucosamine transferase [Candidatus Paceibacterota bacterium]|jgi:UDP-N-acetylglucosamine--N-acetylmuramyl-(pentapeptide) pyrophosphoryl-undecaprenol N-acetylglucosamine transferase|nr:UDP-N-acetylglucosamine--N-acetylmuramyl-(pentapeptide) pyrophosphoryl-undecaprenol N-acetylglucosamine transferase [Candidatus Paceibacterota bacterium]
MKILFTGGGSGGHFYPIVAVAEAINDETREKKLLEPQLYYAAPDPYDREVLLANNITWVATSAGKIRNYFSVLNFFDYFKTGWGVIRSVLRVFFLYPDVVFSTGGYAAFPTLLAAKMFSIPVVILTSDADAGRVSKWAAKFAQKIAVAFAEGAEQFPKDKVAHTGNPVRKAALLPAREGAHEFLKLKKDLPVILVTGGSQGSQAINDAILGALPKLLEHYQVVHQTGRANFDDVVGRARIIINDSVVFERYKPFDYLNDLATRMAAGAADLVVSRAGAGNIFEVAAWGIPTILVPIPEPISHDQIKNAFAYARAGGASVIEQNNLTPGLLVSEINHILGNEELKHKMQNAARQFARPDAAKLIANALLDIALSHEK